VLDKQWLPDRSATQQGRRSTAAPRPCTRDPGRRVHSDTARRSNPTQDRRGRRKHKKSLERTAREAARTELKKEMAGRSVSAGETGDNAQPQQSSAVLYCSGVVTGQGWRLSGAVQRWTQNQWKDNWLVVDKCTIRVYRSEENFTSGNYRPRIQMDILTSVLLGSDRVTPLGAARQRLSFALGLRSGFPGQIADMDVVNKVGLLVEGGVVLSRQRFTIDDGTMLVHFRCSTLSARDSWIRALCTDYGMQKWRPLVPRTMQAITLAASKGSGGVVTAVDDPTARRRRERSAHLWKGGDYMLGDLVGEGGYARIKSGFSSVSGERVAARCMANSDIQDSAREILAMSALKHPNIVELKDVIGAGGSTCLIMELAGGGELFARLCDVGKFTEHEARFYWQQLLTGMMYCHTKGLCHSDLRFENLLLDFTGSVLKITDFGFTKRYNSGKAIPRTILDEPIYVAPEVLTSHDYNTSSFAADMWSDMWSCGVILYTMVRSNPTNVDSCGLP
jgi:hypothetical protein